MKSASLAGGGFEAFVKKTRRPAFLAKMHRAVPWADLLALIEPDYPKGPRGADRIGGERHQTPKAVNGIGE